MRHITIVAVAAAMLALAGCGSSGEPPLRVSGSTTVNPVAADTAQALQGTLDVSVDAQGGSAAASRSSGPASWTSR